MKLGVDLFSIRALGWTAHQYLDYCKKIEVNLVHFSESAPFESMEKNYLREVKSHADELGLDLEVGMYSICPTSTSFDKEKGTAVEQIEAMLDVVNILGSPILRCVLGTNADRKTGIENHIQATIDTFKAVAGKVRELGIKLAIENHAGDMQAWELKELIEKAGPDYVGACIDSGNSLWVTEDPMTTLELLAPLVATSHIRDTSVWSHPKGAAAQWVPMGEGNVGIESWSRKFMELCPDMPFTLEVITALGMAPRVLNYLEPEYWELFPKASASDFARFERLVRAGSPYIGPMMVTAGLPENPPEMAEALKAFQRIDLERSVKYCREVLKVGE